MKKLLLLLTSTFVIGFCAHGKSPLEDPYRVSPEFKNALQVLAEEHNGIELIELEQSLTETVEVEDESLDVIYNTLSSYVEESTVGVGDTHSFKKVERLSNEEVREILEELIDQLELEDEKLLSN